MPQRLFSSSRAMGGIYRAIVVEPVEDSNRIGATIYIPSLHRQQMPFDITGDTPQLLTVDDTTGEFETTNGIAANGVRLSMRKQDYPFAPSAGWWARPQMQTGDTVFIVFENADSSFPVIVGKLGSQLPLQLTGTSDFAGIGDLSGDSIQAKIFNFCKTEMGWNNAVACGILANAEAESGFDLGAEEKTSRRDKGYGLFQWTFDRRDALDNYAKKHNLPVNSAEAQLGYFKKELNDSYKGMCAELAALANSAQGAYTAGYEFCYQFERPKDKKNRSIIRGNNAKNKYWPIYKDIQGTIDVNAIVNQGKPSSQGFIWPISSSSDNYNRITAPFGPNGYKNQGKRNYHDGIDIGVKKQPVFAAKGGTITKARYGSSGYGNWIEINHGNRVSSRYAHLDQIIISSGQVQQGQKIGISGNTGNSTGYHLHFEIQDRNKEPHDYTDSKGETKKSYAQDPLQYVNKPK